MLFNAPNHYFYPKESSDVLHTFRPTNNLDIAPLIQSKAYWIQPTEKVELEKKTLVFSGYDLMRAKSHSYLVLRLNRLIAQGFPVYLYNNGSLRKPDKTGFRHLSNELSVDKPVVIDVEKTCQQLDLAAKQIQIIDKPALEVLGGNNPQFWTPPDNNIVDLSHAGIGPAELLHFLQTHGASLKSLNLDDCYALTKDLPEGEFSLAQLDELVMAHEVHGMRQPSFTKHGNKQYRLDNYTRIVRAAKNVKRLKISGTGVPSRICDDIQNRNQIEALELQSCCLKMESLKALLSETTNLRKLIFYNVEFKGDDIGQPNLSELEELELNACTINSKQLNAILTQTRHLKKLRLWDIECLNVTFEEINFSELEELNLRPTMRQLRSEQLSAILKKTKLKKLSLPNIQYLELDFGQFDFSELEELELARSTITLKQLFAILSQATKLKHLNLVGTKIVGDDLGQFNLTELISLDLDSGHSSTQHLTNLLSHTAKLKKLDLRSAGFSDEALPGELNLNKLEELNLSAATFNSEQIAAILSQAPNLKILNLSQNTLSAISQAAFNLAHLETVYTWNCSISSASFNAIFRQTTKLKKLMLCNMTLGPGNLEQFNFSQLEELNLSDAKLTFEQCWLIVNSARDLKRFTLFDVKLSEDEIDEVITLVKSQSPHCKILRSAKRSQASNKRKNSVAETTRRSVNRPKKEVEETEVEAGKNHSPN